MMFNNIIINDKKSVTQIVNIFKRRNKVKQKNRECTIVRDLFDVYIEHLTYEETNDFIEEHIKKCTKCRNALKNFQEEKEIQEEEFHQEEEIRYLKRLRRKIILIYFTVYAIAIIIILGAIYFAIRY